MNAAVHDEDLTDLLQGKAPPAAPTSAAPSAPVKQPPIDEIGPAYAQHRSDLEGRAALASLLSESNTVPEVTAQSTDVPRGTSDADTFRQRVGREPSAAELANFKQFGGQGWAGDKRQKGPSLGAMAMAEDIGLGLTEAPRQGLLEGPRNAFQAMLNGATDLGTWLEKSGDLPGLKIDEHGVHVVSGEELQGLPRPFQGKELPDFGKAKTVTGGIIESASQFITSMATLGRAFGPMGTDLEGSLGHLATMGKSAVAMFAGFDKASGNVADLIEKVPALSNPITRYLKSDTSDNEAEGRLKNALTGVGFGELQNGLLSAFKMLRGALTAKDTIASLPDTPGPEAPGTVQTPAAFKFLGDPEASPEEPLAQVRTPPESPEASKAARAQRSTEGLTPEEVSGMREPQTGERPQIETQYHVDEDEVHHVTSENGETTAKVRGDKLQILNTETKGESASSTPESQKWRVQGKPVWEMAPEELDQAAENIRSQDIETLKQAFGNEEDAKWFARAADSNSEKTYTKAEKMIEALSPEKRAIVEKWERGGASTLEEALRTRDERPPLPQELTSLSKDVNEISSAQTPEELTQLLKYTITKVADHMDPSKMNIDELSAMMQLQEGLRLATEKGWDIKQISVNTIRSAARRFSDPEDAVFMLRRYLNPQVESESANAVSGVEEPTGAQGKGEGAARLVRMADEAADRGLTLASDTKVSAAAAKVYDRLEKQGYPITRNPAEPDGEGNLVATAGRPVFEVGPKPGVKPGPGAPGTTGAGIEGEPEIYINFARIDAPDDVKRVMSELAEAQKDNIDIAKRGIRSFEETKLGASFEDAWKTLMDRRIGQPLNAEQQLAGRQLLAQSATKAEELTRMATEQPTPENLFAWRKQLQTHAMIQAEVSGSQAEIARALGAMRIPVSGEGAIDRMAAITTQLDQMGGLKSNMDFLKATKALIDSGQLEALGNIAEKSFYARTRDGLITAWTNGLLTNPLTHVKVNLSNIGTIALRLAETRFAETLDTVTDTDGVPAGEAAQATAGLMSGIKDCFRYVGSLLRLNEPPEQNPVLDAIRAFKSGSYGVGTEKPEWMIAGQESGDALAIADSGWVGKATDLMSSVVTSPGRALTGEHEFYRSIGMRMELNRFAYRQAISELSAGKIDAGDLAGRVAELVENPPKSITTAAVDGMTYQTFTDAPGKLADIIANLREAYPVARVVIPFYKIPARIMSFTFERSPLAPLMAGWRADIAAGGARQSMALAKTGIGSMVMLAASDAVLNGVITGMGPNDKGTRLALQNEGWQPYSVKLPDGRWVQYNRIETIGSSIAMAADLTETTRDYFTAVNKDDPNVEKLTAAGIATLANNVTSKTYFEGLARFFETVSDPKSNAESYLKAFAGSLVPAGVGAATHLMDPYSRATYDMMDAIKSRTPGVSDSLPPLRNLWGEPVRHDSGFGKAYDAFVPFATHHPGDEPIDKEILKQGMHFSLPAAKTSFDGAMVDLSRNPQAYSRYVQLAGNELQSPAWGMGAKDLMNAIVTGNHPLSVIYNMRSDGADGGKYVMLRDLMEQYRKQAKSQVLEEFQDLKDKVDNAHDRQTQLRMPVLP